jgi:hypothetical protein
MTDNWIIQDIEKQIAQRNRMVIIDPSGECAYLLPHIEKKHYTILLTLTLGHPNRPPKTSHRKVERLIYALV